MTKTYTSSLRKEVFIFVLKQRLAKFDNTLQRMTLKIYMLRENS